MSLNVILGKSNTGKSEYIMTKIMACEKENKQAILFVPPTGRIMAEEEYLKYTNKKCIIDTKITNLDRYISQNIDKVGLYKDKKYLPDLAKKMLIRNVILNNPDIFSLFSKVKEKPGFINQIEDYVIKFNDEEIIGFNEKYTENDMLKAKINEFIDIYNVIKDELKTKFVTSIDEYNYYIDFLNSSVIDINAQIFIDGYNNFSELEYEVIEAMLKKVDNMYITLDLEQDKYLKGLTEIYNTSYNTFSRLKDICAKNGVEFKVINLKEAKQNKPKDIAYLADNIFSLAKESFLEKTENIKMYIAPNVSEEIKFVANDILKNIHLGYSFYDIAIYTNDIETYYNNFKKLIDAYNIPVYINSKENILNDELVVFLTVLYELAIKDFGKSVDKPLILLKTGLFDICDDDISLFENYILEFGIKGYKLYNPFTLNNNYDLDKLNNVREKLLDTIVTFKEHIKNRKTSKEITEGLYNYISESDILTRYESLLGRTYNVDKNEYNRKKQTIGKIYEVMDNINLGYNTISKEDYLEMLKFGLKNIMLDTIPAMNNQVEIIDINVNRGTEKKIGYIIGCYDTGLPLVQTEDGIFSDIELQKLKQVGVGLKETSEERNNMQLFNIYQAVSKVREKLTFTMPASSQTGSSHRESSLLGEVKRLLKIPLESINNNNDYIVDDSFKAFLLKASNLTDDVDKQMLNELLNEYSYIKDVDKFSNILDYSRSDLNLKESTTSKVYKEKINSSVSKLEQFKRCPFAYYSKYVLNLEDRKEYTLSSLDTGSFMHEVIEKFSKFILSKNISWQDVVIDEKIKGIAKDKVSEIVDKIFEDEYSKYLTENKYVIFKNRLKKVMTRTIFAIADSFNHSEFRPLGYEIEFSKDSIYAPIEVDLEDGKKLLLKGKIDRIDSYEENGSTYIRIVDYKSSDKNLKLSDIKSGISLQLMTYMWAIINNKEKISDKNDIIPASLSYFTISNNILNIPIYEQDEEIIKKEIKKALKLKGIYISDVEILKKLDNNFSDSSNSYLEATPRTISNTEKVLAKDVFKEECMNVSKILKQIGKEIVNGNVKIMPNPKIKNTCEYCSYSSICRKNMLN